jgi:hypothetical protein
MFSSPLGMYGGDAGTLFLYSPAPGVARVGLVPVSHGVLAEAPAEKYTPSVALPREVHQPRVEREAILYSQIADLADASVDLGRDLLRLALQLRDALVGLI